MRVTLSIMGNSLLTPAAKRDRLSKVAARFCFSCHTAWSLTCERRDGYWVRLCKHCGDEAVLAPTPDQRLPPPAVAV